MSAMLTADWFLLGQDTYYRKFEIYSMEWQQEVNMDNVLAVGAQFGGPVAIIRDKKKIIKVQASGKPVIGIYSSSGKQISSIVWNRSQLVGLGWSMDEELLCIQDDGSIVIFDMFGVFKHCFSVVSDVKVIDGRIFTSPQGTGVAVLTASGEVYLVNNIKEPKTRHLTGLPKSNISANCWTVLSYDRRTEVLLARNTNLYLLRQDEQQCMNFQKLPDVGHEYTAILEMAVTLNGKHIALFTDAGYIWLGSSDLQNKYREIQTGFPTTPRQLVWCSTEAVLAHWDRTVVIYGRSDGEGCQFAYDTCVHLIPEKDSVRILSGAQHELVQSVPSVVQKIFRINSTEPGSFLLEASKQYQKRSHRADEYISLVFNDLKLAVRQCIEAAAYEFDPDTQRMLIRAAQFGKCFLAHYNSDLYVNMCRQLRVLNSVRDRRVGIPVTYTQVQELTYKILLDRLVVRKHYYLAISAAKYLRLAQKEGTSRILCHWAEYKVASNSHRNEDADAREIADKLGHASGVSYSQIAQTAANCGRPQLAIKLLDYEPHASLQVPLLLKLTEYKPALLKAIESGDTDLIQNVLQHMHENMMVADFRMTIRNFPVAQALYKKHCQQHSPQELNEIHIQEDDFSSQARESLKEYLTNPTAKSALLSSTYESYRKARNELGVSICEETQRLHKAQKQFETTYKQHSFQNLSVHDTCAQLLELDEVKAADRFRSDFRIPERRYWWLRVRALAQLKKWTELEQLSKSKKNPLGFGPFVDVCLDHKQQEELDKYLPRVPDDLKVKYYVKAGRFESAAKIAYDQRDTELLLYVQRRSVGSPQLEQVQFYVSQINSRK